MMLDCFGSLTTIDMVVIHQFVVDGTIGPASRLYS